MGALLEAYSEEAKSGNAGFELVSYQFMRADRPHIVHLDDKWRYHPECEQELRALIARSEPCLRVSMLQGEQAVLAGMIVPEQPFGFYFPGENGEFDPGAEIVPFDVLLANCKLDYRLISDLLDALNALGAAPALALSPPPPIGDSQFILARNPRHANISEYIGLRGLPATAWRYRIWQLHTRALRTVYQERNIVFVDPPREAYGEDGCLRQAFWADVFHANARYGRLLLRQIQTFLTDGS